MRIQLKRGHLAIGIVITFILFGSFIYLNKPKGVNRGIASEPTFDSREYKIQTVKSIVWKIENASASLQLLLPLGMDCKNFLMATVYFRPEGLSEDGEISSLQFESQCQNGKFQWQVPTGFTELMKLSLSKPDFFEVPEKLFISQISLEGPSGKMLISSYEINELYGQQIVMDLSDD
jgi:hypothetical protein